MDLFGSFAMDLGNLEGDFCIVELGLDKQEGALCSSTARYHSWEQHLDNKETKFGKVEDNF